MSAGTALPATSVRDVVADLVQARDAQIAQVVAMVDGMPDRGQADTLIAPLRARLAQIRPARPFGFTRLLFSPMDPLIIPAPRWRRGEAGLPRTALAPMGRAVQAALPALSQGLEPSACRIVPDDRAAITALGATLWPAAATALQNMAPPPDWNAASGLGVGDFQDLAMATAAVLRRAFDIETLAVSRSDDTDTAIRDLLVDAGELGGLAATTMVSILLARLKLPARVMAIAAEISGLRQAADKAIGHTVDCLQAAMTDGGDATDAAAAATRMAALLEGMEDGPAGSVDRRRRTDGQAASMERRRRTDQIRRDADEVFRTRFDRAVGDALDRVSTKLPVDCDDETIAGLEGAARDLRRLEGAGRRLGSGEHYDAMVQSVAAQLRDGRNGLGLADRVRLVEILAGPDEALAMLLAGRG